MEITDKDLSDTPGSVRPAREYEYRPYYRLAVAVIRQTIADYLRHRIATRYGNKNAQNGRLLRITSDAQGFLFGTDTFWRTQRGFWFGVLGLPSDARTVTKVIRYYNDHVKELDEELT